MSALIRCGRCRLVLFIAAALASAVSLLGCGPLGARIDATDNGAFNRATLATGRWGVDLILDEAGNPSRLYVEGEPGGRTAGNWIITPGTSPDGRPYLLVERIP